MFLPFTLRPMSAGKCNKEFQPITERRVVVPNLLLNQAILFVRFLSN